MVEDNNMLVFNIFKKNYAADSCSQETFATKKALCPTFLSSKYFLCLTEDFLAAVGHIFYWQSLSNFIGSLWKPHLSFIFNI